jgi:hypothetical protein
MNNELTPSSSVYNFVLDNRVKENANGKIMVGIYNNFAKAHNAVVGLIRTRKNLVPKYKNMNIICETHRPIPQAISRDDYINVGEKVLMAKIMEYSMPSIVYGESMVHHNFDFCEAFFLQRFKGKFELETEIEKYRSISFVGEAFSEVSVGTNINAIGEVRDAGNEPIPAEQV